MDGIFRHLGHLVCRNRHIQLRKNFHPLEILPFGKPLHQSFQCFPDTRLSRIFQLLAVPAIEHVVQIRIVQEFADYHIHQFADGDIHDDFSCIVVY